MTKRYQKNSKACVMCFKQITCFQIFDVGIMFRLLCTLFLNLIRNHLCRLCSLMPFLLFAQFQEFEVPRHIVRERKESLNLLTLGNQLGTALWFRFDSHQTSDDFFVAP